MSRAAVTLWRRLPPSTRWALLPLLSTAFLVEAGTETARVLLFLRECLRPGDDSCAWPGPTAVADVAACLLAANLGVFFLVLRVRLSRQGREFDGGGVSELLIDLFAVALTVSRLFAIGFEACSPDDKGKSCRPEIAVYAVYVVIYALVIPFFVWKFPGGPPDAKRASATAYLAALRQVGYVMSVALVVFFIGIAWSQWVYEAVGEWFACGRSVWGVNPAALSIGVLQFLSVTNARGQTYEISPLSVRQTVGWLAVGLLVNAAVGLVAVDKAALCMTKPNGSAPVARAAMAAAYSLCFFLAAGVSHCIPDRGRRWAVVSHAGTFALVGIIAAVAIEGLRAWVGSERSALFQLVWMQGVGFALVGACMAWMSRSSRFVADAASRAAGQ